MPAGALVSLVILLCSPLPLQAEWTLLDGARVHPDYHGPVPKKSDVIFSTRFKRPEAPMVAKSFGATRVEWVYSSDREFISSLKSVAPVFGGAINSNASGMPEVKPPSDDAMAKDFDGNSLIHALMKAWGNGKTTLKNHPGRLVTTTHPETEERLKEQAKFYLNFGADAIQVDDPMLQVYSGIYLGGEFNASTLARFNEYVAVYPDKAELSKLGLDSMHGDYREFLRRRHGIIDAADYVRRYKSLPTTEFWYRFLRETVRVHFRDFRRFLNATRGSVVPLSMNLGILDWPDERKWHFFLAPLADYAMAETPIGNTAELLVRAATARALGLGYVPSLKPRSLAENRVAIATLYALGGVPLVPWDVYSGNDENGKAKRFFGQPHEYGDLYDFVRKCRSLFDDKEYAAVVGIPVPVHNFKTQATAQMVKSLIDSRVPFAFILTGGTEDIFRIDRERAHHFKLLASANADNDFRSSDLHDIESLNVRRIVASLLDNGTLTDLSPFVVAGDAMALKLYPRISVEGDRRLMVHVIDEDRGDRKSDKSCKRRIGLKKGFVGSQKVTAASWYSGDLEGNLQVTDGTAEIFVTVPECTLWGVLALEIQ